MPSCTTHRIFGEQVMNKAKLNNMIDTKVYAIFNQSFDNLMYYHFFGYKNKKRIQKLSKKGHRKNTQKYLINIVKLIKENNLTFNKQCLAYLYGSINHYVLDSTMHPFIFYKTGVYNEKKINSYKYNGLHTKMEAMLNVYFFEKTYHKKYYKSKFYQKDFPKTKFSASLLNLIDQTFLYTYNEKNVGKIYYSSYKTGKFIFRFGVYDRFRVKKLIYSFIDLFRKNKRLIKYVSYNYKKINKKYINLEKNTWYHPVTKKRFNYSIDELYDLAMEKSLKIIAVVNKVLFENKDIKILYNVIENISYITGCPVDSNKKMKYFEF